MASTEAIVVFKYSILTIHHIHKSKNTHKNSPNKLKLNGDRPSCASLVPHRASSDGSEVFEINHTLYLCSTRCFHTVYKVFSFLLQEAIYSPSECIVHLLCLFASYIVHLCILMLSEIDRMETHFYFI